MLPTEKKHPIVLYDGVCGLCNGLVQFLLRRDHADRLRFASLQSQFAHLVLSRHGEDPDDLDTVYVVLDYDQPSERLLVRSDAILSLADQIGGVWRVAGIGWIVPKALRDVMYRIVATNRYRLFGKHDTCLMPQPGDKDKFIDI